MRLEKTWKDVYKLPLKRIYSVVFADNHVNAITILQMTEIEADLLLDCINGIGTFKFDQVARDDIIFYIGGVKAFMVRGWGHLKGMGLSTQEAVEIQEQFCNFIMKQITNEFQDKT